VIASAIVLASCVWLAAHQRAAPPALQSPALVDYERDIQPIIKFYCLQCHSQDKRKGGLSLATYADVLEGGKDGPIVRPGRSRESMIVASLNDLSEALNLS